MTGRKTVPWSNEEVGTFLSLIVDDRIQRELDGATKNEKVFKEVSCLMTSRGHINNVETKLFEKKKK